MMKALFPGVALLATLAFTAPAWAQPAPVQGGSGPKASGPVNNPPSAPPSSTAPSAGNAPAGMPENMMPPSHRHARHVTARKRETHARRRGREVTGSTANQLNQEEIGRLQAGSPPMSAAAPAPMAPPASSGAMGRPVGAGPKASTHGGY